MLKVGVSSCRVNVEQVMVAGFLQRIFHPVTGHIGRRFGLIDCGAFLLIPIDAELHILGDAFRHFGWIEDRRRVVDILHRDPDPVRGVINGGPGLGRGLCR